MPRLKDLLRYLALPGLENIWVLLDIKVCGAPADPDLAILLMAHPQLDNDADDVMRLIAKTIREVPPSYRPWNQRIVLGCWAVRVDRCNLGYDRGRI